MIYTTVVPPGLAACGMKPVTWEDDLPGGHVFVDHFEPAVQRAWREGNLASVSFTLELRRILNMRLDGLANPE